MELFEGEKEDRNAHLKQPAQKRSSPSMSSVSSGPSLRPPQPPAAALLEPDFVEVRRSSVRAVMKSLNRACTALRHAEQVAAGARRAFRDEAASLEGLMHEVDSTLRAAAR